jgi:hypothetical protein
MKLWAATDGPPFISPRAARDPSQVIQWRASNRACQARQSIEIVFVRHRAVIKEPARDPKADPVIRFRDHLASAATSDRKLHPRKGPSTGRAVQGHRWHSEYHANGRAHARMRRGRGVSSSTRSSCYLRPAGLRPFFSGQLTEPLPDSAVRIIARRNADAMIHTAQSEITISKNSINPLVDRSSRSRGINT